MSTKAHPTVAKLKALNTEIDKIIVGYPEMKRRVIQCLISDGHLLLQSVPGLGKTLMVEALAQVVDGAKQYAFQMTPDMKPSDILGGEVFNPQTGKFEVKQGPIIPANFVIFDEINRTTPKTLAAGLRAMQERYVTLGGQEFELPDPFLVMATMNPVEQEGTFPLPEALLDRFAFEIRMGYVSEADEIELLRRTYIHDRHAKDKAEVAITMDDIIEARKAVVDISANTTDEIRGYIVRLTRATRPESASFRDVVMADNGPNKDKTYEEFIAVGASPRCEIWMLRTAAANAFMDGRESIMPDDVKSVFRSACRHRIVTTQKAKLQKGNNAFNLDDYLTKVMETVKVVS